jgi:hypothetical protein
MRTRSAIDWLSSSRGIGAQWVGVLAGPVSWAIELTASYALVQWTCRTHSVLLIRLTSIVALAAIAGGAWCAWHVYAEGKTAANDGPGRPETTALALDRSVFMAALGLMMCGLFALVVLAEAIPRWMLDACQQ